jgi:hypothetical protein
MPPRDMFEGRETPKQRRDMIDQLDRMAAKEGRVRGRFGKTYDPPGGGNQDSGGMSYQEFLKETGRSDTDPHGNTGRANRFNPNYTNILGNQQIDKINRLAYDKYLNPYASVSGVTGQNVGGELGDVRFGRREEGILREGMRRGDITRFGTVEQAPRTGISSLMSAVPFVGSAMNLFGSGPVQMNPMTEYNVANRPRRSALNPEFLETGTADDVYAQVASPEITEEDLSRAERDKLINDIISDRAAAEVFRQERGDFRTSEGLSEEDALIAKINPQVLANYRLYNSIYSDQVPVTDPFMNDRRQDSFTKSLDNLSNRYLGDLDDSTIIESLGQNPEILANLTLPVPPPERITPPVSSPARVTPPVMSPVRANTDEDLAVAAVAPQPLDSRVPDAISLSGSRFLDDNSVTAEMLRDMGVISGASDSDILPDAAISPQVAAPEIQTINDAAAFERYRDEIQSDPFAADYDDAIAKAMRRVQGNTLPPGETLQSYREGLDYLQNIGMADPQFAPGDDNVKNQYDENIPSLQFEGVGPLDAYMDRLLMADDTGIYMDPDKKNSRTDAAPLAYDEEGVLMSPTDMMGAFSNIAPNLSASEFLRETGISAEQLLELQQNRPDIYNELFSTERGLSRQMDDLLQTDRMSLINREQGV